MMSVALLIKERKRASLLRTVSSARLRSVMSSSLTDGVQRGAALVADEGELSRIQMTSPSLRR